MLDGEENERKKNQNPGIVITIGILCRKSDQKEKGMMPLF